MDLAGKTILVIGLARTGLAAARFLLNRGSDLLIFDDKTESELGEQVAQVRAIAACDPYRVNLCLGGTSVRTFAGLDLVVLSPGVPLSHPTVQAAAGAGVPIISEIELAYRFLKGKIVAITGSNGKTTCTTMIGAILKMKYSKVFVSGNIGPPLIDQLEAEDESSWHAVELSSFQLESVDQFRADVAVMLNLTPDHIDRYGNMERYATAKERIFRNQRATDAAILNADDPLVAAMAPRLQARIFWFSRQRPVQEGVFAALETIWMKARGREQQILRISEIPLRGSHNVENVLACAAAGIAAGVAPGQIADAVRRFEPVEHRLEYVDAIDDVAFFNDSKATNVESAMKALEAFSEPLRVIMGGRDKGADFSTLRRSLTPRVKELILIGEAASKIEKALGDLVPARRAADMEEAVRVAFQHARPGDVVLLAPACASFDMFRNFEERGKVFKAAVLKLKQTG
ncbi:MAG TPA: UDP-N-acetylmuramoyl-L-alanine--D-glutamate ligase [Acidobacteriota bacterium]|jgi:UDP-N-acetylmuramoylalanine--D-glutamate ligase